MKAQFLGGRLNRIYSHLVLQLEQERAVPGAGDKKGKASSKISTIVNDDIKGMRKAYDSFVSVCEGLNEATKDFLTDQLIQRASGTQYSRDGSFSRCFDRTLDSFQPILEVAAVDIEVKKGQNPVALKDAILALADLYRDMTGRKPSRVYDGEKISSPRGRGETGHFHEFVRTFMDLIPERYGVNGRSLAGHIRQVCESTRRMDK